MDVRISVKIWGNLEGMGQLKSAPEDGRWRDVLSPWTTFLTFKACSPTFSNPNQCRDITIIHQLTSLLSVSLSPFLNTSILHLSQTICLLSFPSQNPLIQGPALWKGQVHNSENKMTMTTFLKTRGEAGFIGGKTIPFATLRV